MVSECAYRVHVVEARHLEEVRSLLLGDSGPIFRSNGILDRPPIVRRVKRVAPRGAEQHERDYQDSVGLQVAEEATHRLGSSIDTGDELSTPWISMPMARKSSNNRPVPYPTSSTGAPLRRIAAW
jgi:hypothetical protein